MMVATGQERGTRRRAESGRVETCVAQTILCQPVKVRRRNLTAESAPLSEAAVINQHEKHVRRSFGRLDDWYLVRLRVLVSLSDDTFEGGSGGGSTVLPTGDDETDCAWTALITVSAMPNE